MLTFGFSVDRSIFKEMKIYVPWGFIAIFISFYIFREYNRVRRAKRDERREYLNERRQQLIDNVVKAKKRDEERLK
jgi:hypothetical protein